MTPTKFWKAPIHFFARRVHFIDHMLPVWEALKERRGNFYVPEILAGYAQSKGIENLIALRPDVSTDPIATAPRVQGPMLVAAYGDMAIAQRKSPQIPFILMEHGVGLTFSGHSGYAGGLGLRSRVSLTLAPNEFIRAKTARVLPKAAQVVIGTPKLDPLRPLAPFPFGGRKPTVCISFHWNGQKVAPEAGNAFGHYASILPELGRQTDFRVIGHGHPKFQQVLKPHFERAGIEFVEHFSDVMEQADLYVNDCSSTMYEFCVTGKPVVILNAPWFRKNISHGIRFWEYTDIGPQVEEPGELMSVISEQLAVRGEAYACAREKMVADLYPFLGCSAQRAAGAVLGFLGGKQ